jgi:hypothetical protein
MEQQPPVGTTSAGQQPNNAPPNELDHGAHPMARRWVPLKHTNGLALYVHQSVTHDPDVGGEFMCSSIVRGTPEQCLAALTHTSSTTTVLGPAPRVHVCRAEQDAQVCVSCEC